MSAHPDVPGIDLTAPPGQHTFHPEVKRVGQCEAWRWHISDFAKEVSVYAASPKFVQENCGPIAKSILERVPQAYFDKCKSLGLLPNIDFRVHRLNKGEFPAVPGWHCDGVKRETYHGQPDLDRIHIRDTVLCCVSSGGLQSPVCAPEIITEPLTLRVPDQSQCDEFGFWAHIHKQVPETARRITLKEGDLVMIGAETIHRCTPAAMRGWRAFFRLSMWHNDYIGDGGEVAKQQQVYVLSEGNGW